MSDEPRKHTDSKPLGRLSAELTGEQYPDLPILDTKVEVSGGTLCWISWKDREAFFQELNEIISKYEI